VAADLTVTGLEKAGKDLTLDGFVKGLRLTEPLSC